MLGTWIFFTAGGLFTALYSNAVRRYPLMRKPQLHVACTGVACYLGYLAHRYEETSEERVQRLLEKHNAPVASSYMNMSRERSEKLEAGGPH